MGIRGLEPFIRDRKLSQTCPLSALSGTRLGIDASFYIKTLLYEPDSREPLVAATGGIPLAIAHRIEADLRNLEGLRIKPVFVFAGLPISSRPPQKGADPAADREAKVKNEAWTHYENGEVDRAIMTLTQIRGGAWTDWKDMVRTVLRIFRHRAVEYIIAPYLECAQLAYLLKHPKGYIHAMYASSEALAWPVDRVITSIDWTGTKSFEFIDKNRVLMDLGFTPDQFLDMTILAGSAMSKTFPPVTVDFALKSIIDLLRQYKSGIAVCQTWRQDNQVKAHSYVDIFMRARLAVKYSLVLTTEGNCVPLPLVIQPGPLVTPADVPADIDEIFSLRLPDELYYHICKGLISAQVVGWLTSGIIMEPQPMADSPDYRRFIKDVITEGANAPRCLAMALLIDALHPQWRQRRIGAHYYFDPPYAPPQGTTLPWAESMSQSVVARASSWHVPYSLLESELRRQNSSTIDIKLCIETLTSDERVAVTRREKPAKPMDKKDEIVANVIWRLFDIRGFVTPEHTHSLMGTALHAACSASRVNDRFQESIFIFLELLRAGVVHGGRWGGPGAEPLSGGPSFGSYEEQSHTLLIMRVLSILPLQFKPQQWAGPLSRELLVFNAYVRSTSKALRQLFEAVTVHLLLTGDGRRNRDDFLDMILGFPFQTEVNTGYGILTKTYLDAAMFHLDGGSITAENVNDPTVMQAKKSAMEFVSDTFSSVKLPESEVERGFRFWDAIMAAMRALKKAQGANPVLDSSVTSPETIEAYERADRWLAPMRP